MFFIAEIQGCLPYVAFLLDTDGKPLGFKTRIGAQDYAEENCAWEYRIVEF